MKQIVIPKFRVGERVTHISSPGLIMVISTLMYESKQANKTYFGSSIYFQTENSNFEGVFLCEWVDSCGKHVAMFNQNVLELAE